MARDRSKNRGENQALEPRTGEQSTGMRQWPTFGRFGLMSRFFDDMDRMFGGLGLPAHQTFSPRVDVAERDGRLMISADLPGLKTDDVTVEIADDAVIIEGERKYEHEENEEGMHRVERSYGHFRREIPLPDGVNTETAKATFKNGVLEITLDAPQGKNRRRLEIEGGEQKTGGEKAA
jgi:HSP20 family protein